MRDFHHTLLSNDFTIDILKAFNYWLKIPEEKLAIISEVTQMLHNASLL